MFGGQSHPDFDNDMAAFVEPTRQEEIQNLLDSNLMTKDYPFEIIYDENGKVDLEKSDLDDEFLELLNNNLEKRIRQAMQGIVFNLNTMHSRAGQMWAV